MNIFGEGDFFNKSHSKFIRYLLIFLLIGIFLMLFNFDPNNSTSKIEGTNSRRKTDKPYLTLEEMIENKLERILSQIQGAGEVVVDITLESGSEYTYARDYQNSKKLITEGDGSSKTRRTENYDNKNDVIILNKNGGEKALVKKEIKPKIRGVLVIAEGAEDSYLKALLMKAVKVGLGVPSYKIVVLPKER